MVEATDPGSPVRIGMARVWSTGVMPSPDLIRIAMEPGERLSISRKSEVVRVGGWAVKRSRWNSGAGAVRLTLQPDRYRRGWNASRYLATRGVCVPELAGYIEWAVGRAVWRNALVSRYLDGHVTIRNFALNAVGLPQSEVIAFLNRLADAVIRCNAIQAYHSDLADKNVFTNDGERFVFVDLESVIIPCEPGERDRVRNCVQLLDAFYDIWPEAMLDVLVKRLAPRGANLEAWRSAVLRGLDQRIADRDSFIHRANAGMAKILKSRGAS